MVVAAALSGAPARAQGVVGAGGGADLGGTPETSDQTAAQGTPGQGNASIQSSLGPAGDPGGLRAALSQRGVTYSLVFIGEALGDPVGGARQALVGEDRFDLQLDIDLKTAVGIDGAALHANGYRIGGAGLGRSALFGLSVPSGIEALPSTRLFEAWYEQSLFAGVVALKVGQIGADTEFLVSQYAGLFINATYGWPNITGYDLPSGGPAYPLAAPGLRLKLAPDPHWTVLAAVFDGDPSGAARLGTAVDPQILDRNGTAFRLTDRPLAMAELAYAYGDKTRGLLPGIVKVGGWRHFGDFAAAIPTASGLTLGSGTGALHGNDGVYALVDQMIYRVPGSEDGAIGLFARLAGAPDDRNLVSLYADGGITGKGLVPGRPDDTAGLSTAITWLSSAARRTDRAEAVALATPYPIRSSELLFEATYQAQVIPGFTLQPDLQYVVRPGGNIPNPLRADLRPIPDALVVGLRATIQY